MAKNPVSATLFAYNVGFGDCFLLRFEYPDRSRRHILIDFGTTSLPDTAPKDHMVVVARDIAEKCGGKLEAVVATHRHADHISGYATRTDGKGSGEIIRDLTPDVVIQPWTEAPDAPVDWEGPQDSDRQGAFRAHLGGLNAMHDTARNALLFLNRAGKRVPQKIADQLRFIGEDNLANLSAVKNLQAMGVAEGARNEFVFHGCKLDLAKQFPGVKFDVLGPPTLRQTDTIRKQRSKDKEEYWHLAARRMALAAAGPKKAAKAQSEDDLTEEVTLFPEAEKQGAGKMPAQYRWLQDRIDSVNAELALGLVRELDKAMNNTSVILVLRAGGKTLLFPGDAQWENWAYALQSDLAPLLDNVDLYKVGHHGSLNATPKTMWNRFAKRGDKKKQGRLTSVVSTKKGKHGSEASNTEVPRRSLVKELDAQSTLVSTETISPDGLYKEITIPL